MNAGARRIAARALAILAASLLLAALVSGYASRALLNADQFADRASAALEDDAVSEEIGRRATDELVALDADLIAVRPLLEQVISGIVGSGAFRDVFRVAAADVHRAVFERDHGTIAFTVADIGAIARGALQALKPKLAKQVPAGADTTIFEADPPSFVLTAVKLRPLPWILLAAALLSLVGALGLSRDRRATAITIGISVTICGVIGAVALSAVRAVVLTDVDAGASRDAAAAIWNAFFGDLRTALLLFSACGVVLAAAASSMLRPVEIGEPLARAWSIVATVPASRRLRALRAGLLVAGGVLIVINHEFVVELVAVLAGLYLVYAGVSELMRLTIAPPHEVAEIQRAGRRPLIATVVVAVAILAAGGLFIGVGGAHEEPAAIETVGCNGSEALCERPFDEVAFPATHNAMSAATNPGWLFAQQEVGFADQLHDGVRGFLIDAHYGRPTESGTVETDLSEIDSGERAAYEAAIGPQALQAALRIRDRIVDSPATGPRQVYLCHRFCELGAIPIDKALREFRDFLAANPDEVLVIDIEDYVAPADIATAVEETGLIDYVYEGRPGDPWPTLGEMIESGGRVLMLAEHDAGGGSIPWYHSAYRKLVQETPFSFPKPGLLTDKKNLPASCEPNRGPAMAPLFLINHWVDTSPAPRPSNARKVNAREPLLRRIRDCERIREVPASLIAVDFYREGDLIEVVAELNDER
jgi:hypothetical protein